MSLHPPDQKAGEASKRYPIINKLSSSKGSGITVHNIGIQLVDTWDTSEIIDLYRAAGWWKEDADQANIRELIRGSFLFAVAVDLPTGRAIGMGRVLSDGVSDGYIQDLVVFPGYRKSGIGKMIVSALLEACQLKGLGWIGLIAEPGSEQFYLPLGFRRMEGYIPLLHHSGREGSDALHR